MRACLLVPVRACFLRFCVQPYVSHPPEPRYLLALRGLGVACRVQPFEHGAVLLCVREGERDERLRLMQRLAT